MYTTTKVLLLLTVVALLPCAETLITFNQRCLCESFKNRIPARQADVKDIIIYSETAFCNKLEIVVILMDNKQICLNPKSKQGRLVMSKRSRSTLSPAN